MSWLIVGIGAPASLVEVNPHGLLQTPAATLSSSGIQRTLPKPEVLLQILVHTLFFPIDGPLPLSQLSGVI